MIDVDRLRKDLIDNYGTLMMKYPVAVMYLSKIEKLSDDDLILFAEHIGFDLYKYLKDTNEIGNINHKR